MSTFFADQAAQTLLVRCSTLVLISLVSCARADPPETFVADPALQNDFTANLPATGSSQGFNYEIVGGQAILEGDMILGSVDGEGNLLTSLTARGVGQNSLFSRWPDGVVVYEAPVEDDDAIVIPGQQTLAEKINTAIQHWTDNTNMTFVERTTENSTLYPNYIMFVDSSGCASFVGRKGGAQAIYLSDACSVGSVIHELGHAIGLFHEHTRPDRDNFVSIDFDEIVEDKEVNFELLTEGVDVYSDYDYGSIMHYGETFFSKSGKPTIIVPDGIEIGQREALSEKDIESANNMYETDLAVTAKIINTSEGEYEIDLSTYNYGDQGANQVELLLRLDKVLQWNDISEDSGWDCSSNDAYLQCTRDTFVEQTQSLFNVQITTLTEISDADLSVRLSSRTQDLDLSNNSINDEGVDWDEADTDEDSSSDTLQTRSADNDSAPDLLAANEPSDSEAATSETDITDTGDSSTDNATSESSASGESNESTGDSSSGSEGSSTASSSSGTELASTGSTSESSSGGSLSGFILALLGLSLAARRTQGNDKGFRCIKLAPWIITKRTARPCRSWSVPERLRETRTQPMHCGRWQSKAQCSRVSAWVLARCTRQVPS